jgi:hypothetical protein
MASLSGKERGASLRAMPRKADDSRTAIVRRSCPLEKNWATRGATSDFDVPREDELGGEPFLV